MHLSKRNVDTEYCGCYDSCAFSALPGMLPLVKQLLKTEKNVITETRLLLACRPFPTLKSQLITLSAILRYCKNMSCLHAQPLFRSPLIFNLLEISVQKN